MFACMYACIYVRASDVVPVPRGPEQSTKYTLTGVVSCHMVARNQAQVCCAIVSGF